MAGYWKCINKAPMCIQICIGLADTVRRPKILGNRVNFLTLILIAMDYFFFIYFRDVSSIKKKTKAFVKGTLIQI